MPPLGRADATVHISEDAWYRIATGDVVIGAPDRTMRSYGTLDRFEGDVLVDTGTTARTVDITVEEWGAEPDLRAPGGRFAEVVEDSVPFEAARLRVLEADGSELLAIDLRGGTGDYRLRLYSRYLDTRHVRHLLRLWPAPTAREWHYQLDEDDGQPVERPDRSSTETFAVTMTSAQAKTIETETRQMVILETQAGDIDDVVEDCLQISDVIGEPADRARQVAVALTARQWKVALAVLEQRSTDADDAYAEGLDPDAADAAVTMRRTHELIVSQIGDRLPAGRVLGL